MEQLKRAAQVVRVVHVGRAESEQQAGQDEATKARGASGTSKATGRLVHLARAVQVGQEEQQRVVQVGQLEQLRRVEQKGQWTHWNDTHWLCDLTMTLMVMHDTQTQCIPVPEAN